MTRHIICYSIKHVNVMVDKHFKGTLNYYSRKNKKKLINIRIRINSICGFVSGVTLDNDNSTFDSAVVILFKAQWCSLILLRPPSVPKYLRRV